MKHKSQYLQLVKTKTLIFREIKHEKLQETKRSTVCTKKQYIFKRCSGSQKKGRKYAELKQRKVIVPQGNIRGRILYIPCCIHGHHLNP